MVKFEDKVEKHIIINMFDMGFDRAANGGNDLFGESVSLIEFTKVRTDFEFCLRFPSVFWLATSHCSLSCALMCLS